MTATTTIRGFEVETTPFDVDELELGHKKKYPFDVMKSGQSLVYSEEEKEAFNRAKQSASNFNKKLGTEALRWGRDKNGNYRIVRV